MDYFHLKKFCLLLQHIEIFFFFNSTCFTFLLLVFTGGLFEHEMCAEHSGCRQGKYTYGFHVLVVQNLFQTLVKFN